jgi:probable HAF family extracellular repeat protein
VSDRGQAVGDADPPGVGYRHAFSWTQAGGIIDLGTLGGGASYASDVNDRGQVAGAANTRGNAEVHAVLWSTSPGPPQRQQPPANRRGIRLVPLFVGATLGGSQKYTVALMTFPKVRGRALPGSDFHVELRWGDRSSSAGEVSRVSLRFLDFLFPKIALYSVQGAHRYLSLKPSRIGVTVSKHGVRSVTGQSRLLVDKQDPTAYFFSTPDTPHQAETAFHGLDTNTIADVVPAMPGPLQRPISEFRWEFGDGNPVIDSAKTRPKYLALLAQLARDAGNNALKQKGIDMGILPGNAKSGPLGIGGLSADEVRQIVRDWQAEFPAHVVPHIYPYSGTIGVRLTVTDTAGKTSQYARNLTVSQECLQWGGNGLFGVNPFRGYTTCDTRAGFESEIGPHRAPDYVVISLSKGFDLPPIARGLSTLCAAQVYITRGVLDGAPDSVLLGAQMSIGLNLSSKDASVGFGWVGPPDPSHQPSDAAISSFRSRPSASASRRTPPTSTQSPCSSTRR